MNQISNIMPASFGHNGGPPMEDRWYQREAVDKLIDYCFQPPTFDTNGKPVPRNPLIGLPTGTGKSLVIAMFLKRVFEMQPGTRGVVATHVKELLKQNSNKLFQIWPLAPVGFCAASMNKAETTPPIIFGSIQTVVGKYAGLGKRNFLLIDETHLVGNEGSYISLIARLREQNPYLIVIGLSATLYRLGMGLLTNGDIFTDIIYDMTTKDGFNTLLAQGYLSPLITKKGCTEIDVSSVGMSAGDYNQKQLQQAAKKLEVTDAALQEAVAYGANRWSWLVFASGIEHANYIAAMLETRYRLRVVVVHSERSQDENDEAIKAWKEGRFQVAVNMNGMTTGIDHPALDYIVCLRPTASTSLWVQMAGRGTRPYDPEKEFNPIIRAAFPCPKENCLVMDYAGNTRRLGPINDPVIPRKKGEGSPGDAPVRICPVCSVYNHARARFCIACNYEFPLTEKLNKTADNSDILRSELPQTERFKVQRVVYAEHTVKATGRKSIKAAYQCGFRTFYKWFSVEGEGLSRKSGRDWFRQILPGEPPETDAEVLAMLDRGDARVPESIWVWVNKKYPEVLSMEF